MRRKTIIEPIRPLLPVLFHHQFSFSEAAFLPAAIPARAFCKGFRAFKTERICILVYALK